MPDRPRVLLIERNNKTCPSLAPALQRKGYQVIRADRVETALQRVNGRRPDIVVLHAASLRTSGARLAARLRRRLNGTPLILVPAQGRRPSGDCADAVLEPPFTARKLLNHIHRLLPPAPEEELRAGPIRLDVARRVVRCHGRCTRLTPKLAALLRLLMLRRGTVVSRAELMRRVWRTDYLGDLRTIDVHVSWLRRAIEEDPRSPRHLVTVRGVGYRL